MTDINAVDIHSASSYSHDDEHENTNNNNSYLLNQSNVPMDIDVDDQIITSSSPSPPPPSTTKTNGYRLSDSIENGTNDKHEEKDVFHLGNPVLNKSFDVLPQIKDDTIPTVDSIVDNTGEISNSLDTTVELPTNELNEKLSQHHTSNFMNNNIDTPTSIQPLLPNQFSLEYPYVIPQPQENIPSPSSPPNSLESMTALTKNMKLNAIKTSEGQEPLTPMFNTEKTFDTNTFVLKKKERRKPTTPATETSFNALTSLPSISSTTTSSILDEEQFHPKDINTNSLHDFLNTEKTIFQPPSSTITTMTTTTTTNESDMIKSLIMNHENPMEKSTLFRSLIEHTEPTVNAQQLTEHFSLSEQEQKRSKTDHINEHLLRPFSECVEQYYRILYRVCECTEELKHELRQVKNERDQMSEDLINAENAYADVKKRNEKLKLIINEHKMNTETLKRFSEESVRYTEEQKQKYAVLKQHAQEKLNEANTEIERLRRTQASEMEGVQTQLRYAQLRVQSLEQEMKSVKQELEQKKKENIELTNICDELLATNKR
ncbi:hypothetical protein I4U23_010064 [Adineta vaga]|nr:hypothetical protein I4U23_010064 [Adineta vaga]